MNEPLYYVYQGVQKSVKSSKQGPKNVFKDDKMHQEDNGTKRKATLILYIMYFSKNDTGSRGRGAKIQRTNSPKPELSEDYEQ